MMSKWPFPVTNDVEPNYRDVQPEAAAELPAAIAHLI